MDPNLHYFPSIWWGEGGGLGGAARGGPLEVFPLAIIASYDLHVAGLVALVRGVRTIAIALPIPSPSHLAAAWGVPIPSPASTQVSFFCIIPLETSYNT